MSFIIWVSRYTEMKINLQTKANVVEIITSLCNNSALSRVEQLIQQIFMSDNILYVEDKKRIHVLSGA